jgi:uncharacterized protein YxjI
MNPRIYLEQKLTLGINRYSIYDVDGEGNKTKLIAFAEQKRLARREKITFYTDETKSKSIFTLRAEKVLDINGRYFIEDEESKLLGTFKKEGVKSLTNSTWTILDAKDKPIISVFEENKTLAFLRRYTQLIPIAGDIAAIPLMFFKFHFVLASLENDEQVGYFKKLSTVKDQYLLLTDDENYKKLDWRVYAALAVGLDALQSR